ncbi:MAG TPA: hypothetical protein VNM43_06995 [Dehalococcoidia bacterium]|nr:hypothetical protein [Dehalococcoidia bacterium]
MTAVVAMPSPSRIARRRAADAGLPAAAGLAGAAGLVGLYLGIVTWAQGFAHARELLWGDRYFVAAIAVGFGTQIALYTWLRRMASRARVVGAAGVTAVGAGSSTAAMVACCAHHATDVLPLVGLSAAAVFLNDYRLPIMAVGLATNAVGVAALLRLALRERARLAEARGGCEVA